MSLDQCAGAFVVELQLCPWMAQRHENKATDDCILRCSVIAVDAWHQPPVRLQIDLYIHFRTIAPHPHDRHVAACTPPCDKVQEMDPLIVAQRNSCVLANLNTV
eukprot:CAMPEP_0115549816 /NCGR_PEP_ID=MMETSP0271-20121206/94895_1 /TAXON_ID=71861 /ORGANISM="Scrippsiella trochoidea, Strain CCMP3099" /LENGTH=103 /DNA_ID=CAMNT_0002983367 /DNA_START=282 /DNA_END=593 /DNA_ORIENTATION=+